MKINFSSQVREETISITKTGDALTINDVAYDFAQLPENATLPATSVDCEYIVGDVTRVNGDIELTLLLPITPQASEAARFPAPITVTADGPITLPE